MITRAEPQFDQIKNQLLEKSTACPLGTSYYFIRSDGENACICRIKPANGAAIFYEILDHRNEGISDDEIRQVVTRPSSETPLAGYFYLTPAMETKILTFRKSVHISLTE